MNTGNGSDIGPSTAAGQARDLTEPGSEPANMEQAAPADRTDREGYGLAGSTAGDIEPYADLVDPAGREASAADPADRGHATSHYGGDEDEGGGTSDVRTGSDSGHGHEG